MKKPKRDRKDEILKDYRTWWDVGFQTACELIDCAMEGMDMELNKSDFNEMAEQLWAEREKLT